MGCCLQNRRVNNNVTTGTDQNIGAEHLTSCRLTKLNIEQEAKYAVNQVMDSAWKAWSATGNVEIRATFFSLKVQM